MDEDALGKITEPGCEALPLRCIDGSFGVDDIARAAHISVKDAQRACAAYQKARPTEGGAILTMEFVGLSGDVTRAALGRLVAEKMGLGVFGVRQRAAARKAERAASAEKKERRMGVHNHPWKTGVRGRMVKPEQGGRFNASLLCRCGNTHVIGFRQLAGSDQMDNKFRQAGWSLDPPRCPACNTHTPVKETVSMKPSQAAIQSQAKMFRLLGEHFDVEAGCYREGWSDARVATETNLAAETIKAFRDEAFGPLKESPELAKLASDIDALASLIDETVTPIKTELQSLRARLSELRRKFAA